MTTTLILPGATSQSVYFKAIDNTTGLAATTVTSATAGLAISYQNTQTGTVTAISLSDLAATNSAWSSGGIKHIAGGVYRLCIPDAAVPATEGARTIIAGTATAFQILGCELVGKPVEVVSGSLVAASVTGAVGSVTGAVGSVTGNVGGNVVGSVASVTGAVGSVSAGGITAASIATGAVDADALAADAGAKLADIILRRTAANIEASANGDALSVESVYGLIMAAFESAVSSTTWTIRQTGGSTLGTKTVAVDSAADPIVSVT